jgi:hypothetical protein
LSIVTDTLNAIAASFLLLLLGDLISTFLYHVPEHVFGKFHTLVHHSKNRSFVSYALHTQNPWVLVNGGLAALPYFMFVPWLWQLSPTGTLAGILIGKLHVIWRHSTPLGYQTPLWLQRVLTTLYLTTPERHWLHHSNANLAYGDIFSFYDLPARYWLYSLRRLKRRFKQVKVCNPAKSLHQ